MSVVRDNYNLKKIQKFNNIDKTHNTSNLKEMIIKPEKILKPSLDMDCLIKNRELQGKKELDECIKKRENKPWKGIIQNYNYDRKFEKQEDLIVHKVTTNDKLEGAFEKDIENYNSKIQTQNKEINDTYSKEKQTEHKKKFEYQHKYKFTHKLTDNNDNDNLQKDRIEFYKKEQQKMEDSKKKIDDILLSLIDTGALSENLDTIDYDKINIEELEKTLIKEFGEDEFSKLMNEIKN